MLQKCESSVEGSYDISFSVDESKCARIRAVQVMTWGSGEKACPSPIPMAYLCRRLELAGNASVIVIPVNETINACLSSTKASRIKSFPIYHRFCKGLLLIVS